MKPTLVLSTAPSTWPDCATVNWRRVSSGLWRVPEGDIHAAYSTEHEQAAPLKELAECGAESMPRTKDEMRRLLEREANPVGIGEHTNQIDFPL